MFRVVLLVLSVVLSGCASVKDIRDSVSLNPKEGIMLVNFDSNYYSYKVTIIDKKNVTMASAIFDIKKDDNLRVITLPAGNYTWRGIYIGTSSGEFRNDYDFTIEQDHVNYVGDVHIEINGNSYNISFSDNDETIARFKTRYPILAGSKKIIKNITDRPNRKY